MTDFFLFIDFQKIFRDNQEWKVPDIEQCFNRAKEAHELISMHQTRTLLTVKTKYLPPSAIINTNCPNDHAWKKYFDLFPSVPRHKNHELYNELHDFESDTVWISNGFNKWRDCPSYKPPFNVFITGVSTECCVLSTALSAVDSGANVYIISDACTAGTSEDHILGLSIMSKFKPNIQIITTKDIPILFNKA